MYPGDLRGDMLFCLLLVENEPFEAHGCYKGIPNNKAWIMKVTVNTCLNHLKRRNSLQQKLMANLHLFKGSPEPPVEKLVFDNRGQRSDNPAVRTTGRS